MSGPTLTPWKGMRGGAMPNEPITLPITLAEDTWLALNQIKMDVAFAQATTIGVTPPTDPEFMAEVLTRYAEGRQIHFYLDGEHLVYTLSRHPVDLWYPDLVPTTDMKAYKAKQKEETYDDPN